MSQIEAIQATATDALSCKIYAIKRGYYRDDPMTTLITAEPERKSSEIASGTWARVMGTRSRLEGFLQLTDGRKNIINCESGFDTYLFKHRKEKIASEGGTREPTSTCCVVKVNGSHTNKLFYYHNKH